MAHIHIVIATPTCPAHEIAANNRTVELERNPTRRRQRPKDERKKQLKKFNDAFRIVNINKALCRFSFIRHTFFVIRPKIDEEWRPMSMDELIPRRIERDWRRSTDREL